MSRQVRTFFFADYRILDIGNSNIPGIDLADFALLQGSVVERCD